jgi:hypothetical protein
MATRGRPRTFDPDTTVVQGLSVQARDGATRAELEAVITCAMAAWETLTSAPSPTGGPPTSGHDD